MTPLPTSLHALSALLLVIAYFVFPTDARNFEDSVPFLSLVPLFGTISLPLCDMLKLSLTSGHCSGLTFPVSHTPNTSSCLQLASSKSLCACVRARAFVRECARVCVCVCVCVFGGGRCLMKNLCVLILCVLVSVIFNLSVKCTRLGFIWERVHQDATIIIIFTPYLVVPTVYPLLISNTLRYVHFLFGNPRSRPILSLFWRTYSLFQRPYGMSTSYLDTPVVDPFQVFSEESTVYLFLI